MTTKQTTSTLIRQISDQCDQYGWPHLIAVMERYGWAGLHEATVDGLEKYIEEEGL